MAKERHSLPRRRRFPTRLVPVRGSHSSSCGRLAPSHMNSASARVSSAFPNSAFTIFAAPMKRCCSTRACPCTSSPRAAATIQPCCCAVTPSALARLTLALPRSSALYRKAFSADHPEGGMAQIASDPNRLLYHGTLRQNLPSIRETGLLPQRGAWTARYHTDATALVFAVDDINRSAAILAIAGQMANAALTRGSENYSFDDFKNDLIEHGAVIVVRATTFGRYPLVPFDPGHPPGAEPGNWYSSEPVGVESEMTGKEMLAWLKPNEQDFIHRYRKHMLIGRTIGRS
jgi:hypothetical protein